MLSNESQTSVRELEFAITLGKYTVLEGSEIIGEKLLADVNDKTCEQHVTLQAKTL